MSEAKAELEATLAENAGLHQQLLTQARAGILDERQRMAREIHDTLAQDSPGSSPSCRRLSTPPTTRPVRRHFAAATRLARESLTELAARMRCAGPLCDAGDPAASTLSACTRSSHHHGRRRCPMPNRLLRTAQNLPTSARRAGG